MATKRSRSGLLTAEIISIGNELLIGHTLDTNSHWIAKRLNKLGWKLERVIQLRDSLGSVEMGIRESLRRRPRVLITLGGLGPTHDDMTMVGMAKALRTRLRINRDALGFVKEHYQELETQPILTKYRTKMATLPLGSSAMRNPVGTAPGVRIQRSNTTIFSLPGVPSEMKAIFLQSILPYLKGFEVGRPTEIQIKIAGIIESALAPIIDNVRRAHPGLYFKSHPRGRETGIRPLILLHIYNVRPKSSEEVASAARKILRQLSELN